MKINSLQRCKPLLGTFVEVSLQGQCSEQTLLEYSEIAFAELTRIQHLLSFHEPNSELSQVNTKLLSNTNSKINVGNELAEILTLAQLLNRLSTGSFDLTVAPNLVLNGQLPNHLNLKKMDYGNFSNLTIEENTISTNKPLCLDLGGIAKGYAVDQAVKNLPEELNILINAGGDLYQNNWQGKQVQVKYGKLNFSTRNVTMRNYALATSGNYHLNGKSAFIEPKNQKPRKLHGCISVFASSVMLADALTKLVILMPPKESQPLLNLYKADAFKISRLGLISQLN